MKKLALYLSILAAGLALLGWIVFKEYINSNAIPKDTEDLMVYIPSGSTFEEVVNILKKQSKL